MRKPLIQLLPVTFLSVVLAACGGGGEPAAPPPPEVTVVTLAPETVTLTRELPGRTNAFRVAEVRPQVNGIIKQQLFTEGSVVKAGQALYQLDDASYRASANTARAQLERADATARAARLAASRMDELAKVQVVSEQERENTAAARDQAIADVGAARAALDAANVTLGYARITAPIDGRIGKSSVTPGALVTANQAAPLATINQLDPIYVDLTQSASELLQLRRALEAGQLSEADDLPVTILLEDGSRYAHAGRLAFSEVSVDPSTGSFALRVEVDNPEHLLMPGMYVRAVIGAGVRENAILVPQQGIARDPKGGTSAMVVNGEGVVEQRPVVVSQAIGNKWLVESGLVAGNRVVVEGLQKIAPGAPVSVVEAGTTPAAASPQAAPPGNDAPADAPASPEAQDAPDTGADAGHPDAAPPADAGQASQP